jgi:DNA-binding response OmpR family regulator
LALVLVIDDDAALNRLVSLVLRTDGMDVVMAYNGVEGLYLAEKHRPDVVILDLEMPVMDGRAFFRELRRRGDGTPVIIMSSFGARAGALELGAEESVAKPFDSEDLCALVRRLAGVGECVENGEPRA